MESNCAAAERPKTTCDFARLDGQLLRTADAIYENVATADRCKETCLAAEEFRCRSFDYGETGANVCRISRHGGASAAPSRQQPAGHAYVAAAGATTYQMSSCFGVDVDCRGADMVASVRTDRLFDGKVYAKNRPRTCVNDVKSALDFQLRLDYRGGDCDVRHDGPGKFSAEIIIQVSGARVPSLSLCRRWGYETYNLGGEKAECFSGLFQSINNNEKSISRYFYLFIFCIAQIVISPVFLDQCVAGRVQMCREVYI